MRAVDSKGSEGDLVRRVDVVSSRDCRECDIIDCMCTYLTAIHDDACHVIWMEFGSRDGCDSTARTWISHRSSS